MSNATGLYRTKHDNGMEIAFIDKGVGKPLGIPRDRYETSGYKPSWNELPEK